MKTDIVTVFPEYFGALNVGLFGKAQEHGLIEIATHNLRDWTHDVHHSVDDTPVGGGAGMVMKPEIWAACLDDLLGLKPTEVLSSRNGDSGSDANEGADSLSTNISHKFGSSDISVAFSESGNDSHGAGASDIRTASLTTADDTSGNVEVGASTTPAAPSEDSPVLIFPNPSAPLFTQHNATELSHAGHLIFGCGRYEGYDARIPRYYEAQGVDVREYSIGDYVLNGGEVAVLVMLEAITRLIPGFMGNPDSIVEESYTGANALLEYHQYTRPTTWRGMAVPAILTSGDHGKVDRFRRDEALKRTSTIRPDLIEALDCSLLDKSDRKTLMALGWEVSGMHPRRFAV